MKTQISALELAYIIKELQELKDAKVEKVYLKEDKDLLFVFHVPNKGKRFLRVKAPNFMYLTDYKGDAPETPHGFCMFLRKKLNNARLREIKQINFERIVELIFTTKEATYKLFFEFFNKGNVILCDENEKILSPLENQRWKDRVIRGNVEYKYPEQKYNFLKLKEHELVQIINESKQDNIVKILAIDLGLGGIFSEELLQRSGVDKNKKKLHADEIKLLFNEIREIQKLKLKPIIAGNEILPFELTSHENKEKKEFKRFNEALDNALTDKLIEEKETEQDKIKNKEVNKVMKIIEMQTKTIKKLKKDSEENQKKGELIYEKYQLVEEILKELKKAREKYSWKEIKEKLKGHKVIKEIDEKNNEVVIEI